jgi:hypothetical protein
MAQHERENIGILIAKAKQKEKNRLLNSHVPT